MHVGQGLVQLTPYPALAGGDACRGLWRARCSASGCGWTGPERDDRERARQDLMEHQAG